MVMDIGGYKQTHRNGLPPHININTIHIGWKRPQEGWVKLNCDKAHESSVNLLGCDDLLWDNSGTCLNSYACKFGSCDMLYTTTWDMYIEMDLTQR
jgi:hypothetical protein